MADQLLEQAKQALQMGDPSQARRLLRQSLRKNRQNLAAWSLFAELAVNDIQKAYCLEQVLRLDENNEQASQWLAQLRGDDDEDAAQKKRKSRSGFSIIYETTPLSERGEKLPSEETVPKLYWDTPDATSPSDKSDQVGQQPNVRIDHSNEEVSEPPSDRQSQNCGFLRLYEDRHSQASYPSIHNACYQVDPPVRIDVDIQKKICLSKGHVHCLSLRKKQAKGSLLSNLKYKLDEEQ